MTSQMIYHVSTQENILSATTSGTYGHPSLENEGFIHCCLKEQVEGVLERYYQGQTDLRLLEIDPEALNSKVVFENTSGGEELFPHVYGEINMSAVQEVKEIV